MELKAETRIDKRPIKEIFPNAVAIVEYAFTLNEVDYYQFSDFSNMSSDRGFSCIAMFEELKSGCSNEYLKAFEQAFDDVLNKKEIKLTDLFALRMQLKERRELIVIPDIAYKLCSVVFFDATENPNRFDWKKGALKAEIFKQEKMADFFLSQPIIKLLPRLHFSAADLQEYLELATRISRKHIEDISTMLSAANKNSEWWSKLVLQSSLESV